jgi:hypothetical protein
MPDLAARLAQLRRARLASQRQPDLASLLDAHVGLHSTLYTTPYLSSWARIPGFDPAAMFDRLQRGDGLVRVGAMRTTLHVVSVDDLPDVFAACGPGIEKVGRRALKKLSDAAIARGIDALLTVLADGPQTTNDLRKMLPDQAKALRYWTMIAMGRGLVVRADAAHAASNRTRLATTTDWIGALPAVGPTDARRRLIRRAVAGFGPVTIKDLAWWLPAPQREVKAALDGAPGIRSLTVDGTDWWFPEALDDAPGPSIGAWVLPYEDSLLKAYKDRDWLVGDLQPVLFPFNAQHWRPPSGEDPGPGPHQGANVSGEARPSVWWDGRAVGRWEREDTTVVHELHVDPGPEGRAAIQDRLAALQAFLDDELDTLCR